MKVINNIKSRQLMSVVESCWKLLSVDVSWWQLMSVDDSWCQLMIVASVDVSWWQLMSVDVSWWQLMTVDDSWCQLMSDDVSWWQFIFFNDDFQNWVRWEIVSSISFQLKNVLGNYRSTWFYWKILWIKKQRPFYILLLEATKPTTVTGHRQSSHWTTSF